VIPLQELLADLAHSLDPSGLDPRAITGLHVTDVSVDLPLEARLSPAQGLLAFTPRGVWATGFDPPRGRLRATWIRTTG